MASNSRIVAAWRDRTPGSAELAREAAGLFPSGITHDARLQDPYGPYIARARGGHKWDVDGNRYADFYGGHGALILGHAHPEVTAAISAAAAEGTQFGASHPREVLWAAQIRRMVPSCERIRFTSSGTEATLMAVRLARAFTGRPKLLRFKGHFHGWHDHMTTGFASHFDGSATPGVLAGVAEGVVLAPPGDLDATERLLAGGEVAAVILEPTGASFGRPVKARASRTAISVASVPEEVKRMRSQDGSMRRICAAHSTSRGWLAPNCVPSPAASAIAAVTSGCAWPRISAPWPP